MWSTENPWIPFWASEFSGPILLTSDEVECVVESVPPTSTCHTVTNMSCLCGDSVLLDIIQTCVSAGCLPEDAMSKKPSHLGL